MATSPKLDGPTARELFDLLGDVGTEIAQSLSDMNDAFLTEQKRDYWEAAIHAARASTTLKDVLSSLARGDYDKARRKLGIEGKNGR